MTMLETLRQRVQEAIYANDLDEEGAEPDRTRIGTVETVDLFGNVEDTRLTEIEYNRLAAGLPAEAGEQAQLF